MQSSLSASQTLERARSLMESGRGAALPELLKLIETLSLNLAEVTVPELAELIEKDAVVLTRVIAVANTLAHNPGIAPLATLSQAIHQIGYNRIRTIAVSLMLLETAGASSTNEQREAAATALGAGLVAQGIAQSLGTHDPELTFACAALRNLGRILMAAVSPEFFREAVARTKFVTEAEAYRPLFGLTPVELSRRLLSNGRLPESVTAALRDFEPETVGGGLATTHDARLLGIADFGSRLAILVLDAREGPDAFKRKSGQLARRFEKLLPGAVEVAKPALQHADRRLSSFTRCNGIRSLPTISLGRFRVRMRDLAPAGPRTAEDEIDTLRPPSRLPPGAVEAAPAQAEAPATSSAFPDQSSGPAENFDTALQPAPETSSPIESVPAPAADDLIAPESAWDRDLMAAEIFNSPPTGSTAPVDPWLAALAAARTTVQAAECWVFLPADADATFSLSHRLLGDGCLAPRAAAPVHPSDRTLFGLCLSRHEIVVIHDTRDRRIAAYLPPWWPAIAKPPGAFAIVPIRGSGATQAMLLVGWSAPRRVVLTAAQGAQLDQLVRGAIAQTTPAVTP